MEENDFTEIQATPAQALREAAFLHYGGVLGLYAGLCATVVPEKRKEAQYLEALVDPDFENRYEDLLDEHA